MKKSILALSLILTACQSNQEIIQQSARNLAVQSPQIANPPATSPSPWIPFLIGMGITMVILVILIFILWQRAVRKAALEKQRAALKAREARLQADYQRKLAQQVLPPPAPSTPPYQPPQEPSRPWSRS